MYVCTYVRTHALRAATGEMEVFLLISAMHWYGFCSAHTAGTLCKPPAADADAEM